MNTESKLFRRRGFSLIEVNLAVMLVAVGLLSLFALFPLSLKESEMGLADTHEAMFADSVLSAFEANAAAIDDWTVWDHEGDFEAAISQGVYLMSGGGANWSATGVGQGRMFPNPALFGGASASAPRYLRYDVTQAPVPGTANIRRSILVKVRSGNYGSFDDAAQYYFTEVSFMGM